MMGGINGALQLNTGDTNQQDMVAQVGKSIAITQ